MYCLDCGERVVLTIETAYGEADGADVFDDVYVEPRFECGCSQVVDDTVYEIIDSRFPLSERQIPDGWYEES